MCKLVDSARHKLNPGSTYITTDAGSSGSGSSGLNVTRQKLKVEIRVVNVHLFANCKDVSPPLTVCFRSPTITITYSCISSTIQ